MGPTDATRALRHSGVAFLFFEPVWTRSRFQHLDFEPITFCTHFEQHMVSPAVCVSCDPGGDLGLWRAFAQPYGLRFVNGNGQSMCTPAEELGKSGLLLPVTHSRGGNALGLWFYYARGCSDLAWDMGRTLLVNNRYDLALNLDNS